MRGKLLASLFLLIVVVSCKKDKLPKFTLPPISQSGANTMGFIVDGRVWQNYGRRCTMMGGCNDNTLTAYYTDRYETPSFSLKGAATEAGNGIDEHFQLQVEFSKGLGIYLSDSLRAPTYGYPINSLIFENQRTRTYYGSSLKNPSKITITKLDTVAHIVSGTFEGTLYQIDDSTKSIKITDGRFDITYMK